jgi:DNA polymerase-3 subunit delta
VSPKPVSDPDIRKLTAALEAGARVVYVHGDATLLVDRLVDAAEAWGLEHCGLPSFNHGRWRASDDQPDQAVVTARTMPMMADLRVVVLRDLEHARNDLAEAVLDYLDKPSPSTLFIAVAGTFGKVKKGGKRWSPKLLALAKKHGVVFERKSAGVDRRRFAAAHAAGLGIELGRREAELLVELVGDDLGRLAQEVEKLAVYVGAGNAVGGADLVAVCSAIAEEVVWELTSGIARRDPELALRALHRLLADGQAPHYLFAMITMQLRKVLQAAQQLQRGRSGRDVGRALRLRPQEMSAVESLARRTDAASAAAVLERLALANREMNLSRAGSEKVIEVLVVELCGGA